MAATSAHPLVIAHRGASGHRPEHTTSAFLLAIASGADAVEPDLVVTRDGVLVIRHENEISGTTDVASRPEFADRRTTKTIDGSRLTGWFTEDFEWAELATLRAVERLPDIRVANTAFDGVDGVLRLEELLGMLDAEAGRRVALVAEIKHAHYFAGLGFDLASILLQALDRAGWTGDSRVTVESFELGVLLELRSRGLRAPLVYLLEQKGAPADRPTHPYGSSLTPSGLAELSTLVDGISVEKAMLVTRQADRPPEPAGLVERAHAVGLSVFTWTFRAENRFLFPHFRVGSAATQLGDWRGEFELLASTGVDGVFADQPALALAARDGRPVG